MMDASSAIFVAGHRGMVGSAIVRRLHSAGYENLVLRTRSELDLTDASATREFFEEARPEYVFLAAAKVGGILANDSCPADFIRENLSIQTSVIHSAWESGVRKLLFLGSSCIYPKHAPQPMAEELLLTGPLETTNDAYAVAKIAGIKMCEAYRRQHGSSFISAMPTNLYGPGDNFDEKGSHVLPGLIRRFDTAKKDGLESVAVWGSGTPRREFLHVDDLADACLISRLAQDGPPSVEVAEVCQAKASPQPGAIFLDWVRVWRFCGHRLPEADGLLLGICCARFLRPKKRFPITKDSPWSPAALWDQLLQHSLLGLLLRIFPSIPCRI